MAEVRQFVTLEKSAESGFTKIAQWFAIKWREFCVSLGKVLSLFALETNLDEYEKSRKPTRPNDQSPSNATSACMAATALYLRIHQPSQVKNEERRT